MCVYVQYIYGCVCVFVATGTNLIPSNSLITVAEADVDHSQTKFGDSSMSKIFKMNAPRFSPSEGVAVTSLSFKLWSPTR